METTLELAEQLKRTAKQTIGSLAHSELMFEGAHSNSPVNGQIRFLLETIDDHDSGCIIWLVMLKLVPYLMVSLDTMPKSDAQKIFNLPDDFFQFFDQLAESSRSESPQALRTPDALQGLQQPATPASGSQAADLPPKP